MNVDQFLKFVTWTDKDFFEYFKWSKSKYGYAVAIKVLMKLRQDLQRGLSKYSIGRSKMDGIQYRAVGIIASLERMCGQDYKMWATETILKSMPNLAKNPRKLKNKVNHSWGEYVRKHSY